MTVASERIIWRGDREAIVKQASALAPGALALFDSDAPPLVPFLKRQIDVFQACALFALAQQHNKIDAAMLEVGTAWGYSAAVIARAAPLARILTLNPKMHEVIKARDHLKPFRAQVTVLCDTSDDLWQAHVPGEIFDFVFIDGDHRPPALYQDMRWFTELKPGGLILFHDYAPASSPRPCPAVVETLDQIRDTQIKRDYDVQVIADDGVGMVGWIRRPGDRYQYQE